MSKEAKEAQDTIPELIKALDDPTPEVRGASAETLGSFGPLAAGNVPKLLTMLGDVTTNSVEVRVRVAKGLGSIGPDARKAVGPLTDILGKPVRGTEPGTDQVAEMRAAAAQALGGIGPDAAAAVPVLRNS